MAASLRADGYDGPIRLIGVETIPPYQRPPLSKGLLLGKMDRARLLFRQPSYYPAQAIELLLGQSVDSIDRRAQTVTTSTGRVVSYDQLVLATGTRVRPLAVPGAELDGVVYLRTIDDCDDLARRIGEAGPWSWSVAASSGSRSRPRSGC